MEVPQPIRHGPVATGSAERDFVRLRVVPTPHSAPAVQRTSKRCCPRLSLGFELDSIERYVPFSDGFGLTACVLLRAFSFETRHR